MADVQMARMVAFVFGTLYLAAGATGFVPEWTTPQGLVFGLFPVNELHNLLHLVIGGGLIIAGILRAGRLAVRLAGLTFLALALIGAIQGGPGGLLHDLIPLHGADVILHALTGAALLYAGWARAPRLHPATT